MPALPLSFACAAYDRMVPLLTGEVKPAGIDLNFIPIASPRDIFDSSSIAANSRLRS
jgi:4,5-dihydroxyphthalate decarboxylase